LSVVITQSIHAYFHGSFCWLLCAIKSIWFFLSPPQLVNGDLLAAWCCSDPIHPCWNGLCPWFYSAWLTVYVGSQPVGTLFLPFWEMSVQSVGIIEKQNEVRRFKGRDHGLMSSSKKRLPVEINRIIDEHLKTHPDNGCTWAIPDACAGDDRWKTESMYIMYICHLYPHCYY
jgi:hypothetical protein